APDFDFVFAREFGFQDLAAHGGGGLFASAVPGAERAVDVVETGDTGGNFPVFTEVPAHALGKEFFPAVAVFGQSGVGVLFLQIDVRCFAGLFFAVVDTRGRGVEESLDATELTGGQEQVRVDQHADHAQALVIFDEA